MSFVKIPVFFILLVSILSCTKNVDFDQIDDAEITPNLILTLVHFDLNATELEDSLIFDFVRVPINDGGENEIEKIELTVETSNSFDVEFSLIIVFYDEDQTPIYTLPQEIIIAPNSSEQKMIIEIPSEDIPYVFDTEYFGFIFQATNGSGDISSDDSGKVNLKSSIEIFYNFFE